MQNKSTLNHARATQRGEREKKEGENLGSRGEGGGGGRGKNSTEEIFTNVTYGYIVMLLMLLTFPPSLNSERSSY